MYKKENILLKHRHIYSERFINIHDLFLVIIYLQFLFQF